MPTWRRSGSTSLPSSATDAVDQDLSCSRALEVPAIRRNTEDFPEPDDPEQTQDLPGLTLRQISSNAGTSPNLTLTFSIVTPASLPDEPKCGGTAVALSTTGWRITCLRSAARVFVNSVTSAGTIDH